MASTTEERSQLHVGAKENEFRDEVGLDLALIQRERRANSSQRAAETRAPASRSTSMLSRLDALLLLGPLR